MAMGFIFGLSMFPKNDESHISCVAIWESTTFKIIVDDM
jgi:hypothetical protein